MLVGINYPWIDYGWDFGDPPSAWVSPGNAPGWREEKRRQIDEDFRAFADLGISAIRWFILADGASYGTDAEAPRLVDNKWRFDPLPREHSFHRQLLADFEYVLQSCAKYQMQFVPSLIDFHWCYPGIQMEGNAGIVKGGRGEIVTDPRKREAFFAAVLDPLLELSLRYHEQIFAWELINEPEWVIRKWSPLFWRRDKNRTIPRDRMLEFIVEGIRRINACELPDEMPAFRSTVGFAHFETLDEWDSSGLGIALHQYHYYAQNEDPIPSHRTSAHQPCFVGELATAVQKEWPELESRQLPQTISQRLQWLERKEYPAAFLWSARAIDVATSWSPNDHQQTLAYLRSPGSDVA